MASTLAPPTLGTRRGTSELLEQRFVDALSATKDAGLRYVTDDAPGIRRRRNGRGWTYLSPSGRPVDSDTRIRIKSLAIPPAWTDVWISPRADGHIQATGRDARGRKQYRYHERWTAVRDEAKYERLQSFARALPKIRERVEADLRLPELPRRKLLAVVVRLLETTLIRVGNEEYARDNESYGLSTLKSRHAKVNGTEISFVFRGKSGKDHRISIRDRQLARIVKQSQELPGQDLFQYVDDDGEVRTIGSADVNEYLREISGDDFTAKDFRTWAGTVLAAMALRELDGFESEAGAKRNIRQAIESVAKALGNPQAVCRKCYVHPAVIEGYLEGDTIPKRGPAPPASLAGLARQEYAVLRLLERRASAS